MRRPHRYLRFGILSTAAFLAGGTPLWADNVTNFPTLLVNGTQRVITSTDRLVFNTAMDNGNLTFADAAQRLVIDTAQGVKFGTGVNVTNDMVGEIEFRGDVTFDLNPTNKTLKLSVLAFVGSDEAEAPDVLTVNGETLALGTNTKVSIDKNLKVDFNALGDIAAIPQLYLGENDDTTLSFDDATELTATELVTGSVGRNTTIDGALQVGTGGDPLTQGLSVTSITINGDTIVNGKLSGGGDTNFIFNEEASLILGADSGGSELADNTKFKISDELLNRDSTLSKPFVAFKPFDRVDSANLLAYEGLIRKLSLDTKDVEYDSGTGDMAYDNDSGYVLFAQFGNKTAMQGIPNYGLPFVNALYEAEATTVEDITYNQHKILAIALQGEAKSTDVSEKLNSLMGNVPNAAVSAALSGNMNQVMGHLNSSLSPTMPGFAGPAGAANGLWVLPGYSMTDISGDPQQGYGDLEIKNPNVTLGYDRWINDRIRMGVFAALSQPESTGDYETIKSDNLQAGLYGQAQLNYGINVNAGVAYSQQSHDAERDIPDIFGLGYQQMASASFNSNALSAAVEVSRLYPVGQNTFVRPTIGYSYVSTSVDGYTEKSDIANQGNSLAQKVEATDFTMHLVKVGAEGGWSNDLTTVTGRLFWVGNMGDAQPKTQASLITDGSVPFTLVGAEYDKNMVNVGLSAQYTPPQTNGLTFGLNYDALLGSNAKSHNLSLMMRYEF